MMYSFSKISSISPAGSEGLLQDARQSNLTRLDPFRVVLAHYLFGISDQFRYVGYWHALFQENAGECVPKTVRCRFLFHVPVD